MEQNFDSKAQPNLPQIPQIPPQEPIQVNSSKFPKPVIVILVIIAIFIAGYFALAKYQLWWPFGISTSQPTPSPITSSVTGDWKNYNHPYYDGVVLFYPLDWKLSFDYSQSDPLFLTSADYQKDKSGVSVNVIIGLTNNRFDWQGTVAGMYGSNSKNELIKIDEKTVFRTTYNDSKVEAISLPISNGQGFISFFLKPQLSTKDDYASVLYDIAKKAQLPNTIPDTWQTYRNKNYGFTFSHPSFTEVKESSQQKLLVFVRYGFHQSLSVDGKSSNESLYSWYTKRLRPDELERKRIIEKKISGYDGLEVTEEVMASIICTTFLSKDDMVVIFTNDGLNSLESGLPADNQKLIESFRFK